MGQNEKSAAEEFNGFRLGEDGRVLMVMDEVSRKQIEALEKRIEVLEALPRIWAGTREEYDRACEAGQIREGDILFMPDQEDTDVPEEDSAQTQET